MLYDITLNRAILDEANLDLDEAIALIAIQFSLNLNSALEKLAQKGLIGDSYFEANKTGKYFIMPKGTEIINSYLKTSSNVGKIKINTNRIQNLAEKMREIYPTGKKPGTAYYWRGSNVDIMKKLETFFKNYGNKYTDEDILKATQNYVNAYQHDNKYMMLLQYFIWKEKGHYEGGTVNMNSELATRLDNLEDTTVNLKEDWVSTLK